MKNTLTKYINTSTNAAPLAVFRIGFGLMMLYSIIRFWAKGWIETVYIQPKFHFKYYGFEWVKVWGDYTYGLFFISAVAAFCVALGFKYRIAIITFFLSFTYIELMEKTTYLNHYYFISILSFLLIFLPAEKRFSIDAYRSKKEYKKIPKWTIDSIKLLLFIVYFYAGLAKLNSDWLLRAMPLKIWLPSKYDLPLIGDALMHQNWFHYAMSWGGLFYDLFIPFLLIYRKTRAFAFVLVIVFHLFTRILFPIGMFPYVMIVSALIFFDAKIHLKIIKWIKFIIKMASIKTEVILVRNTYQYKRRKIILPIITIFFVLQLIVPFRYLLYPNELFWTEEGYRFSWRVMLMEKMGHTNFKIVDSDTKAFFYVKNEDFLTPFQEKQMSFQPDFILEYAHFLGDHFKQQGHKNVEVYAKSYVALNGRLSQPFINETVNLYAEKESFQPKNWILAFNDDIKGL